MTEATPSAEPTSKEERESWKRGILAVNEKGEQYWDGPALRLIQDVDTLERRAAHVAPLMEALERIGYHDETAYLACPGAPNCGGHGTHYDSCPVAIAQAALLAAREAAP